MLDTTAKYIYAVYKAKSVSLAAQELFISQPALSRAIKKAERELGAPIFNRKTLPFSLTAEGKLYIDAVEKILSIEKDATEKLNDIKHMKSGTLRIATSTHISSFVIPKVLKEFHKEYPQVDIHIIVTDGESLAEQLDHETADLVFIVGAEIPANYAAEKIFEEKMVVAMPKSMVEPQLLPYAVSHAEIVSGGYDKSKEILDATPFKGLKAVYSPPDSNILKKLELLFQKSDVSPCITSNAIRQQLNYNLMRSGFGALLTTDANIATMPPANDCMYFVIGARRKGYYIMYPKENGSAPNSLVHSFIRITKELFSGESPFLSMTEF